MSQGDYDANRGYYLAGALSGAAESGDSGMCAELDRLFRKKGYSAGYGRVRNQSYGGSFLETVNQGLAYQITQSQTNIATAFDKVLIESN